jgi:hypothetical protein
MGKINKTFALFLALIVTTSCLMVLTVKSVNAQSIPEPSVPQFTVALVDHPYDVAPTTTTTIDPYTGKETVITTPGYHAENKSIDITIKNQPLATYNDAEGHTINIYYNVRVKGHFAEEWEWKELFSPFEISNAREGISWAANQSPIQSNSGNTVVSCSADYPSEAKVDFQVQALQGYFTKYYPIIADAYGWYFTGKVSSWSNTQTIAISANSTSQSPIYSANPTTQPTAIADDNTPNNIASVPFNTFTVVVVVFAVIVVALSLLLFRSHRKSLTDKTLADKTMLAVK